jgi:hypothetical protein
LVKLVPRIFPALFGPSKTDASTLALGGIGYMDHELQNGGVGFSVAPLVVEIQHLIFLRALLQRIQAYSYTSELDGLVGDALKGPLKLTPEAKLSGWE